VPATLGSKSQLSSVVTLIATLVFLLVGRSLLSEIPRAGLAAVIVAAAFAVIDVEGFRRLAAISLRETLLAVATVIAVITTDLLLGVLVALALSVLVTVSRVARPHDAVLGEGEGLDGWISIDDERAHSLPGLLVYRFDAPLFFANAEYFRERLKLALADNPGDETYIILDFEGVGSIDTTAIDHLFELYDEMAAEGIELSLARANETVAAAMDRAGLTDKFGPDQIFPTINAAVADFRRNGRH
jgi:MFS superfamily sulfate permease-like transporter